MIGQTSAPLLALSDIRAGYGAGIVLDGVSFELPEHGSLAVLGRNGVGKSTLILTIMGYTQVGRGRIFGAARTSRVTPRTAAPALASGGWRRSVRFSPSLTVEENLTVASREGRWNSGGSLRSLPPPCRTPAQFRQSAFRWRAADAGDRAGVDDQSGAASCLTNLSKASLRSLSRNSPRPSAA